MRPPACFFIVILGHIIVILHVARTRSLGLYECYMFTMSEKTASFPTKYSMYIKYYTTRFTLNVVNDFC